MTADSQHYTFLDEPCRNFNILNYIRLIDPRDGREKLVLSNFAAGSTGSVIFIDTETGEGENLPLPGDAGAWALLNWNDEKLLVGTCASYGYVHSLDLATRTWAEPLRYGNETYIWNLTQGSDGMVYGGTYPGCLLLQYDPVNHTLENVGRASDNTKNLYCRQVRGQAKGYILAQGGFSEPFLRAYDLATGQFQDFGVAGAVFKEVNEQWICLEKDEELLYYDAQTLQSLSSEQSHSFTLPPTYQHPQRSDLRAIALGDGRWAGIRGQDYFIARSNETNIQLERIPVLAPATHIHTLVVDEQGMIWGATTFGQTIFKYDPEHGEYWNSGIVCNNGGEVYGMQFIGSRLFMSAYAGGDHIVYDTNKPWDQLNNMNPQTLRSVSPELIRPTGRTVLGPDGAVWTGWSAKYGTYGGGISRIDPDTLEVTSWYDPIPTQQVAGLDADGQSLYFTTNGGASGLAYKDEPCHFAVMSPDGELRFKHQFAPGVRVGQVVVAGGHVVISAGKELILFEPNTQMFLDNISLDSGVTWMVTIPDQRVAVFTKEGLFMVDVAHRQVSHWSAIPETVQAACVTLESELYFASGTKLYRVDTKVKVK